jgi:hypothetical protein
MFKISKLFFCLLIVCKVQASHEIDEKENVELSQTDIRLYRQIQKFIINRNEIVTLRNDIAFSLDEGGFKQSSLNEKRNSLRTLKNRICKVYNNCNLRNQFGDLSCGGCKISNPCERDFVRMEVFDVMWLKNDFYNKQLSADKAIEEKLKLCSQPLRKKVQQIKRTNPILIK